MKKSIFAFLLIFSLILISCAHQGVFVSEAPQKASGGIQEKDWSQAVSLDMSSGTMKSPVSVKAFVDGDTTHFFLPDSRVMKARYLAVNTPEITGKVEEYGKAAAVFTRQRLSSASSIVIESDDGSWNLDSTGDRYLVWVWYRTSEDSEYRNLNIELLQNGLAIASSSANNRYGETCMSAIAQARELKKGVYSGQKDPDFFYSQAIELTLKELRNNIADYESKKVAFEAVITRNDTNSVYVEDYDVETDRLYGITVYYGYSLNGDGLDILSVGNRSRIVGTVQYYEAGGTYQISGVSYRQMKPDDPGNLQKISSGHKASYALVDARTFAEGSYASLALDTSIQMKNLNILDTYVSSDMGMTISCEADGERITVRVVSLGKGDQALVKDARSIDVKGFVDYYDGHYQIKVFSMDDIVINE